MNRTQKEEVVSKLRDKFAGSQLVLLTDFKGLKVNEFNELRGKLASKKSEIQVIKNRLAKLALKGNALEKELVPHFSGTTALTTTPDDPTGAAKILIDFAKDHEVVKFKVALIQGKVVNRAEVESLAKLPSREELIAKALGSMLAPARNWVLVLAQIPRQWVNVLAAVRDQKGKGS